MTSNNDGTYYYQFTATESKTVYFCFADALCSTESDWTNFNNNRYSPIGANFETVFGETYIFSEKGNDSQGERSAKFSIVNGTTYKITFTPGTREVFVLPISDLYLRNNMDATPDNNYKSWDAAFSELSAYKFTHDGWQTDENVDKYTYVVTSTMIGNRDLQFRIQQDGDNMPQMNPKSNENDGKFTFSSYSDGKNSVTYDTWTNNTTTTNNTNGYFIVPHLTIKAAEYKITVTVAYANWGRTVKTKVEIVSMPASIGNSGYATFSCDRALDFEGTDIKAYVASSVSSTAVNMTSVTKVPAGTGLFLKGSTTDIPVIVNTTTGLFSGDNLLHPGADESVASDAEDAVDCKYRYVFQNQTSGAGFYKLPATGVTIPKGKAYLEISKDDAPQAPSFSIDLDGETTGIKVINFNEDNNQNNGQMFDLQGRRIAEPTKGVYIVNGKKVIIK